MVYKGRKLPTSVLRIWISSRFLTRVVKAITATENLGHRTVPTYPGPFQSMNLLAGPQ